MPKLSPAQSRLLERLSHVTGWGREPIVQWIETRPSPYRAYVDRDVTRTVKALEARGLVRSVQLDNDALPRWKIERTTPPATSHS